MSFAIDKYIINDIDVDFQACTSNKLRRGKIDAPTCQIFQLLQRVVEIPVVPLYRFVDVLDAKLRISHIGSDNIFEVAWEHPV